MMKSDYRVNPCGGTNIETYNDVSENHNFDFADENYISKRLFGNRTQNEYLFIGIIADAKILQLLNAKGCNATSGYNAQRRMIDGLEKLGHFSDTITGHVSPALARDTFVINYKSKKRNEYVEDISVSFINLPLIDKLIKKIEISRLAKQWVKKRENPKIFVYSLTSSFLLSAVEAKKRNKKCKLVIIVPDLPEFMSNSQNRLYRLLKKVDRCIIDKCLKRADAFVLFSDKMKEKIAVGNRPYAVVEGIIRDIEKSEYIKKVEERLEKRKKIIMLSGNLDYEEGIQILLEAFESIEDAECKLWLTGQGNAVELIQKYAAADKRITYFGYIDSYAEFLELQQQAFVFVLMVPPTHPKSAYYFPSKLMEYLATAGIVACYKLECIPKEYDEYLEYFYGDAKYIGRQLAEFCGMSNKKYYEKALKRYDFLINKNSINQMKKVEDLVNLLQ